MPANFVVAPLPRYAPELNRMENVWQDLRANKLSARVCDDCDEILNACTYAWNWLIAVTFPDLTGAIAGKP